MSKPEFPTVDEWCDVLGRSMDDPVVLQVRNRIGECEEAESSSGPCWSFNRQGVEINFRRQMGNAMESVDMYGSGAEWSFLKYRGELPAGLKFRMHYEDVLERVGPAVHRNRWGDEFHPFGQFVIMLSYDDETWKLNKVTLMLAAMAAELGARLEVPVRSGATEPEGGTVQAVDTKAVEVDAAQLVSLLGSAITDARVLELRECFPDCLERNEAESIGWCFLETVARSSGFQLSFDSMWDDRLAIVTFFPTGKQPEYNRITNALPMGFRFQQAEPDIVAQYGPPVVLEEGPYGFYHSPDFTVEIRYLPKSRKIDSINYFHPQLAAQMGLRDDSRR